MKYACEVARALPLWASLSRARDTEAAYLTYNEGLCEAPGHWRGPSNRGSCEREPVAGEAVRTIPLYLEGIRILHDSPPNEAKCFCARGLCSQFVFCSGFWAGETEVLADCPVVCRQGWSEPDQRPD